MEFELYIVFDSCKNRYTCPICAENDATAMRDFANECLNEKTLFNSHPQDFTLYNIGTYYCDTGEIISHKMERVCSATDFVMR